MKLAKSVVQKFIYYYLYEGLLVVTQGVIDVLRHLIGLPIVGQVGMVALLASGYLAEALGIPIFAPLEFLAVQVQTSRTREGPSSVWKRTYRNAGLAGFYRGWRVYLLCALQPMIQFTLIEQAKALLLRGQDRRNAVLSSVAAFWLGAVTKAIASTISYPINTGRVLIQGSSDIGGDSAIVPVLARVLRDEGPLGMYKGWGNELLEGLFGAAIQLMVKEQVSQAMRSAVYAISLR